MAELGSFLVSGELDPCELVSMSVQEQVEGVESWVHYRLMNIISMDVFESVSPETELWAQVWMLQQRVRDFIISEQVLTALSNNVSLEDEEKA